MVDPIAKHRRDVWLRIVLPVVLAAGLIVLAIVGLFIAAVTGTLTPQQITVISSVMLTVCILLPSAIVMVTLNALMIFVVVQTGKVPRWITPLLRSIRQQVQAISAWLPKQTRRATRPLIAIDSRLTRWEKFVAGLIGHKEKQSVEASNEQ